MRGEKTPGPDHPITVEPDPDRVEVSIAGEVVLDTVRGLVLHEAGHPPVHYLPREDMDMSILTATDHTTFCPYKGDATYFSIDGLEGGENAVWTYEDPYEAVSEIKGHLAFYPDRVTITQQGTGEQ